VDAYHIALVAHVVGTVTFLAGIVALLLLLWAMVRAHSTAALLRASRLATKVDKSLPVGAALVVASGLYMVISTWGWERGWIDVSLAAIALVAPLVPGFISPRLIVIHRSAVSHTGVPLPAELRTRTTDPQLWIPLAVLAMTSLGVLGIMLAKPSTGSAVAIVALSATLGAGTGLGFGKTQSRVA
jgi:hypothetical protein